MCDWLAQISGVGSALAGLDLAMPGMSTALPFLILSYYGCSVENHSETDSYEVTVRSHFLDLHSRCFLSSYFLFHVSRSTLVSKNVSRT
jgi:hypothetical protein